MRLRSFVLTAVLASASVAGHADSFNFSFGSSSSLFSGSGVLKTGVLEAPGEYLIASLTGTARTATNGQNLVINSILGPGTFPTPSNGGSFPANDNVLFVINGVGSLDGFGLSFILNNGAQINLYNPNGSLYDALLDRSNGTNVSENVPITITAVAATPEPSGLVLLGTGVLGVASVVRRRLS